MFFQSAPAGIDRKSQAGLVRKQLQRIQSESPVARIRQAHHAIADCTHDELLQHVNRLRQAVAGGTELSNISVLSLGGAIVNEALSQVHGKQLYDVQIHAGIVLTVGAVAEMATGEGKTLTGLLPAVLHSLNGKSVHVGTPNAYLAERDYLTLQPVIQRLGLRAGLLTDESDNAARREAYRQDVTYGPGYAFGFDYLRDQMSLRAAATEELGKNFLKRLSGIGGDAALLQRGLHFALLDEIDHVLMDDGTSPLVLSSAGNQQAADGHIHRAAGRLADQMIAMKHFEVGVGGTQLVITSDGFEEIYDRESFLGDPELRRPWHDYVLQALKAKYLFRRDVNYVVRDEKVQIIDGTTGRIFEDRSWNDGLHQAVEAAEGVTITEQRQPLAKVTRQRFYRLYDQLSGMTGTAGGCEGELASVYGLSVEPIPLRRASLRKQLPTEVAATQEEKTHQIVQDVRRCHKNKQPVLVGTLNISESETLAESFQEQSIPFKLLNGKQDASEAAVVAAAGRAGAVTIATNMAGRGTDIHLDPASLRAGGLHVIVSECHQLSRVDRQLVGRAGRQGDPGTVRFFVSLEDSIIEHAPWIRRWLERSTEGGPLDRQRLHRLIHRAQTKHQDRQSVMRRQMLRSDMIRQNQLLPGTSRPGANINVA